MGGPANPRRVAVVTGAGNGIGAAIAARLAGEGHTIAILDIDGEAGEATAARLRAAGATAAAWQVDCREIDAVEPAFAAVVTRFGAPHWLVNNVGGSARTMMRPFVDCDVRTLDAMLALNLKATVYCSRQVVEAMRDAGYGRIVNITSEAPFTGGPMIWDYAAGKGGVVGFTRAIAQELAPHGVNVNAIGPGITRTRATEHWTEEFRTQVEARIPAGRTADPGEIADAVHYLLSDQSSYVTGQTLLVNGGRWML